MKRSIPSGLGVKPFTAKTLGAMLLLTNGSWLASARATEPPILPDNAENSVRNLAVVTLQTDPLFRQTGTDQIERFEAVSPKQAFDVVNSSGAFILLLFEPNTSARFTPTVVRLTPGTRQTVTMVTQPGVRSFALNYSVAHASLSFTTHTNRYRAGSDGESVLCVPVAPALQAAMQARTESILGESKVLVTDPGMPSATYLYTPGPFYKTAGLFARDFLYQLEGAGRSTVTGDEVKRAVD
jgi:hypothetical protein